MSWLTLILIVGVIALAIIAFKALVGFTRALVPIVLAIVAIGLLIHYAGDGGMTSASITDTTHETVKTINHTINENMNLVVELPEKATRTASSPTT